MLRFKRTLGLTVLAGLLAALAFAIPAQAASVKGVCVVDGFAKMTDKVIPTLGVLLIGGKGSYVFDGVVTCAGSVKGAAAVVRLGVKSKGVYHSVVCGTGDATNADERGPWPPAWGGNTLTGVVLDTSGKPTTFWKNLVEGTGGTGGFRYSIEFYAFNGPFYVKEADTLGKDTNLKQPSDGKGKTHPNYDLAGTAHLGPPSIGDKSGTPNVSAGECTKAFHVNASFKVDL